MPFARIDLVAGKPDDYRAAVGDVIYQAIVDVLKAPANDRFMVIHEHPPANFIADRHYANIERSDDLVMIQLTLNEGRTLEVKKAFYLAVADGLHARIGLRREDVLINLVEIRKENWSFGNGLATYA